MPESIAAPLDTLIRSRLGILGVRKAQNCDGSPIAHCDGLPVASTGVLQVYRPLLSRLCSVSEGCPQRSH